MVYYVKEGQSSIFVSIKVIEDECQICKKIESAKNREKIARKMKRKNINSVILSKKIKANREFVEELKNQDITIFNGKWLMRYILNDIIEYLEKNKKFEEVGILVNDLTKENEQNIRKFADKYKKIRIITNHHEKFKRIEEELYEEKGISVIITNNRRKALLKTELIVNFDFVSENLNKYNINENATIINLCDNIKINKKRFCGNIITDYEVEFGNIPEKSLKFEFLNLNSILNKEEFDLKEILEGNIYLKVSEIQNFRWIEIIEEIIKKYDIKVQEIYGMNGKIT